MFVCAQVINLPMKQIVFQVHCWCRVVKCFSLCVRVFSLSSFRSSHGSLQGLDIQTAEAEGERSSVLSEAIDHSNILAYLSGASSSSRQRQQTPERSVVWCKSPYKTAKCDLIDSLLWFLCTCLLLNNASLVYVIHCVILPQCKWATFAHCMKCRSRNRNHVRYQEELASSIQYCYGTILKFWSKLQHLNISRVVGAAVVAPWRVSWTQLVIVWVWLWRSLPVVHPETQAPTASQSLLSTPRLHHRSLTDNSWAIDVIVGWLYYRSYTTVGSSKPPNLVYNLMFVMVQVFRAVF